MRKETMMLVANITNQRARASFASKTLSHLARNTRARELVEMPLSTMTRMIRLHGDLMRMKATKS